jgi:hypothetical protein
MGTKRSQNAVWQKARGFKEQLAIMSKWFRSPKSLDLRWLIRDEDQSFALSELNFSAVDALQLSERLSAFGLSRRTHRSDDPPGGVSSSILIVAAESATGDDIAQKLSDGWRGVIVVPSNAVVREDILVDFFTRRSHFKFGDRNRQQFNRGDLPPFVLDLTIVGGRIFTTFPTLLDQRGN